MDNKIYSLLLLKEEQVYAQWSHKYDRQKNCTFELEHDKLWEEKILSNPKLYNAPKFRLHSWNLGENKLHLNLGLTSYRSYICTNLAPSSRTYLECSLRDYNNCQALMADPLAVGGYLETGDNKFVLIQRSAWCAEAPDVLDRPGGHPEPEALQVDPTTTDLELQSPQSLVSEIFSSIQKEIRDELNLDIKYQSAPLLLGIIRNNTTSGRPIMDFYIRCSLTSKEVEALYRLGTQSEADESTDIIFVDRKEFLQSPDTPDFYNRLSSSLKISLPLLQEFLKE